MGLWRALMSWKKSGLAGQLTAGGAASVAQQGDPVRRLGSREVYDDYHNRSGVRCRYMEPFERQEAMKAGARWTSGRRTHLQKLCAQLAECSRQPERVLFLDVETTGLDPCRHEITIIGWAFGSYARTLVKGSAPDLLCKDLEQARFLVTFNGGRFDTRFIAQHLPGIAFPRVHIDLLYLCRSVGLSGGQKAIEKALRIDLREDMTEVTGLTAVALWNQYLQGDHEALRRLILYNRSDVAAMGAILDEVIRKMNARFGSSMTEVRFRDWSAPPGWRTLEGR